uniref:Uncharacterized protein n=1 Tax=Tetranychus urticae TaxID=32264 RepID=T1JQW9_TETUR
MVQNEYWRQSLFETSNKPIINVEEFVEFVNERKTAYFNSLRRLIGSW